MALLPGCLKNEWSCDPFSTFFSVLGKILEFKGYAVGLKPAFDSVAEMMCVDSEPILAYRTLLRLFCKLHHESLGHSDYSQLTNMLSTEKILQ